MKLFLKRLLLLSACFFALTGQAIADSLSDALRAMDEGDSAKAARLLRPLAKQGNAEAQFKLANLYYSGKGGRLNHSEAANLYRRAAEQGHPIAQSNLATLYYRGEGVSKNYVLAHMWKSIAATNSKGNRQLKYFEQLKSLSKDMSAKQVAEAKKLAKKCTASKFKGCKR